MLEIFAFIIRNQFVILAFCGLGIAWYLGQFIANSRRLGRSTFGLERERASSERKAAMYWLAIFVLILGATVYIGRTYRSQIPAELLNPSPATPNAQIAATATATVPMRITRDTEIPSPTPNLAPTVTPLPNIDPLPTTAAATATLPPSLIVDPIREGCEDNAIIREPASGVTISGGMSLFGKADGDDFSYYRFDAIGPYTENAWRPLIVEVFTEAVFDGFLASADMAEWDDGIYQVRLTVFDTTNQTIGSCLIQIGVLN